MLPVPSCPSRIFVTSSRLYPREISRSFTSLNEQRPTAPEKPRAPPRFRTPNTTDATKRPQHVHPLSKQQHLLQPFELSRRLIALCERGDTDLAVNMLQRAPKNAQNVKVWNTLIQQCLDAERYKLAFRIFIDMKRRGFIPNLRTYATLMSGYATVEDWEPLTKQLDFVHSIYGLLRQQLETSSDLVEDDGTEVSSLIQYLIALYISILGRAGEYQKAFDVFRDLDTDGPLVPHPKVYSALLCLSADRKDVEATAQAVSDVKYIWRRLMRSLDRQPDHHIETRSVDAIIYVLSRGEPSDHELMFDILRDICGLPRPGEDCPPGPPKVEPNYFILVEALNSCNAAGRPEMAVHYAQIVMNSPKLRSLLRVWHLSRLLRAHLALARDGSTFPARSENAAEWIECFMAQGPERDGIPTEYALTSALWLCHRCEDMPSALRIVRAVLEGPARGSIPARAWVHLLRLAIVAPPDDKRQCLELFARDNSMLDVWESDLAIERLAVPEKKDYLSLAHCIVQLLRAPLAPDAAGGPDATDVGQSETWSDIKRRAESILRAAHRFG